MITTIHELRTVAAERAHRYASDEAARCHTALVQYGEAGDPRVRVYQEVRTRLCNALAWYTPAAISAGVFGAITLEVAEEATVPAVRKHYPPLSPSTHVATSRREVEAAYDYLNAAAAEALRAADLPPQPLSRTAVGRVARTGLPTRVDVRGASNRPACRLVLAVDGADLMLYYGCAGSYGVYTMRPCARVPRRLVADLYED